MNKEFARSGPGCVARATVSGLHPGFGASPEDGGEARRGLAFSGDLSFSGRRYWWAWMLVGASFLLVLILSYSLWQQAETSAQAQFERRKAEITAAVRGRMDTYEQALRGGLGLFEASERVSRAEWKTYVEALSLQQHYPGIQGIGYSLRLEPDDLPDHVAAIRAEGFADYSVHPAGPRPEYSTIIYLEPFDERNRQAFGYDMWSEEVRRTAMRRTRDTGETTISGHVTLVQEIDSDVQAGFLMYLPHYRQHDLGPGAEVRREALIGYVYAAFRMRDLMEGVVGDLEDIRLTVHDGAASTQDKLMFDSAANSGAGSPAPQFAEREMLSIRGAEWVLDFSSLPAFRRGHAAHDQPLIVLLAGLISCTLFGFVVWSWGATRLRAEAMAAEMVTSLNRQKTELLRSNSDLEQFAYVASHDLRAPLRNINFIITWLGEDHSDELSGDAREKLSDLEKCAARMDALLNSILSYSRLGSNEITYSTVDANSLVREAISLIGPPEGMRVIVDGDLPGFRGAPARMSQVFANLIGNAIKHHDRPEGTIKISGARIGGECIFRVADDGPGIEPKFRGRVFEMFKKLRSHDEVEGSGMGLAIVQKTIQQHGGRIWIEDSEGARGTCFVFTIGRVPEDA